jgi:DNA-directed RNA polymerase sigma subunit (sigma70/sigma32)
LQKVGEELGITRERVRQIEKGALEQLSRNRELQEEREAA